MALKPCRECGQEVSDQAKTCPKCGVGRPVATTANTLDTMGKNLQGCGCHLNAFSGEAERSGEQNLSQRPNPRWRGGGRWQEGRSRK